MRIVFLLLAITTLTNTHAQERDFATSGPSLRYHSESKLFVDLGEKVEDQELALGTLRATLVEVERARLENRMACMHLPVFGGAYNVSFIELHMQWTTAFLTQAVAGTLANPVSVYMQVNEHNGPILKVISAKVGSQLKPEVMGLTTYYFNDDHRTLKKIVDEERHYTYHEYIVGTVFKPEIVTRAKEVKGRGESCTISAE